MDKFTAVLGAELSVQHGLSNRGRYDRNSTTSDRMADHVGVTVAAKYARTAKQQDESVEVHIFKGFSRRSPGATHSGLEIPHHRIMGS